MGHARRKAIGETPMAATGTVALPFFNGIVSAQ